MKIYRISKQNHYEDHYNGYTLVADLDIEPDNMKWFHTIEKDGIQYHADLTPYDDNPIELMKLWIDAGMPKSEMGNFRKEDLIPKQTNEFQDEGNDSLEMPERENYDLEQEYKNNL